MARRRKNRTHLKGSQPSAPASDNVPKSFVIKHGQVGPSLTQLTRDVRKVMEPNTASRLRERSRNKLKDFLTMAPALQVTHLLAFTRTDIAPSLRIVRLAHGPTLSFRVERYSLAKDVAAAARRARALTPIEALSPPLLVLAAFPPPGPGTPPHLALLMKAFQTLFPPLAPHALALSSARRVVLVAWDAARGTVAWRHFRIAVVPHGVTRRVRRAATAGDALDLGSERDVADYVLRAAGAAGGYESATSASEAGEGDGEAVVDLAQDYVGRGNRAGQKRAVRLDEVGPRMELRLVKIVEGVPGKEGAVIFHEFVKKSKGEVAAQKAAHAAREKVRRERREAQERNVQRKKALGEQGAGGAADEEDEEEEEEAPSEGDGEAAWDEDEEISEGEVSEDEGAGEGSESEGEPEEKPPRKKAKTKTSK
ncbi:Brix domain-containing protein [Gloeopeniophorella convolvens]|nr:Brix domain-containing protein [Gloeopeniophorella convolvens]